MKRSLVRIVAISAGALLVLQTFVFPQLAKAAPAQIIYVDDSADSGCDGLSAALSTDADGHCAVDNIYDGVSWVTGDGTGVVNVAAGDYTLNDPLTIDKSIVLQGAGQGVSTIHSDGYRTNISADDVAFSGFTYDMDTDSGGIWILSGVSGVSITNNDIVDGNGYDMIVVSASANNNTISDNNLSNVYRSIVLNGAFDNTIKNNHIYHAGIAIRFGNGGSGSSIDDNLVQGNTIDEVDEGIVFGMPGDGVQILDNDFTNIETSASAIVLRNANDQTNLTIAYNKFVDNMCSLDLGSGISEPVDATLNWWDSATGPESSDSGCPFNGIYDPNGLVTYEPFLTKEAYATLDPITEVITDVNELGRSGLIVPEGTATDTPSATFIHEITLSVGGTSTISFEEGTVITKTDGGNFDSTALTASGVASGALTGLGTGVVVNGAFQWGIPQVGLSFNPAITLNIFVGTDLNGKTLNILRSISGSTGWSNDGIVDPKTCVVTDGYCTFQATKASYYAATSRTVLPISGYNTAAVMMMARYLGI